MATKSGFYEQKFIFRVFKKFTLFFTSITVIAHDNKQVVVRHGDIYVRVSPCHLQLISESEKAENVGIN